MSLLDTASLIVTPNGYKEGTLYSVIPSDGSGDMSVVRATTATRVNSAGLVELVPYNLLQYSEQFNNGVWTTSGVTVTANDAIAPNGTLTADKLVFSGANKFIYQQSSLIASTANKSIYIKGTAGQTISLDDTWSLTFPVVTLTGEWQRVDFTSTTTSGQNQGLAISTFQSATATTIWVWGSQLVEGTLPKDYQKTETRLNIPRLDYSNGTCPSLLVEPQRTNTLFYSEQFDNAYWSKGNTSITVNAINSTSGILNADKLVENSANSNHIIETLLSTSVGQPYTTSIYFKKGERNFALVGVYTNELKQVFVNLTTGAVTNTVGTILSSNVETLDNGWFRVSLTFTATASVYAFYGISDNGTNFTYQGDGTSGVYIWGSQLEAGSYPTSYIPTTSASVTRNADVVSKTGISSLIGQTEGTIFVDFYNYGNNTNTSNVPFSISNGAYGDAVYFEQYLGNWYGIIFTGFTQQFAFNAGTLSIGRHKFAIAYKTNDIAFYADGNQLSTDTSATIPACSRVDIGTVGTSTTPEELSVNASALWKTRLTNTQLAQLTTI